MDYSKHGLQNTTRASAACVVHAGAQRGGHSQEVSNLLGIYRLKPTPLAARGSDETLVLICADALYVLYYLM